MDAIMGFLQPIIDTVKGIFAGEGGFDPATIIETIKNVLGGIIG